MANSDYWQGNFYGRAVIARSGKIGGAKDVFVKLGGVKNQQVFPTFGGTVKNPFKGPAKLYAGDLAEYRTDANGVNPEYYILKTYLVVAQSSTTVKIAKDGYKHIPFVGDILMKAPAAIGGAGVAATVTAVSVAKEGKQDVWVLTMSAAITLAVGDVLVEAEANPDTTGDTDTHRMVVKNINSVCSCDYDFRFPANGYDPTEDGYVEGDASYDVTLALGGLMYTHKMSPMPACVLALNTAKVNGWFEVGALVATN